MKQLNSETHRCTVTRDGFDSMPTDMEQMCKGGVVFRHPDESFVLCDGDGFRELQDRLSENMNSNVVYLKRHIYSKSLEVDSQQTLASALFYMLERYETQYASAEELEVDLTPCRMIVKGEKTENAFVSIRIVRAK